MEKLIALIMFYAPVGLGAYFAYLVGVFGPQLLGTYVRAVELYYPVAFFYFFLAFSVYAYFAGGMAGYQDILEEYHASGPDLMGNRKQYRIDPCQYGSRQTHWYPAGSQGSDHPYRRGHPSPGRFLFVSDFKDRLAFRFVSFAIFFSATLAMAVGIALLSGTVMSGIPGGGFLGELLIVTLYGFPVQALPIISMVGTLVDPPATMVNATGDSICCMMTARILGGKNWMSHVPIRE